MNKHLLSSCFPLRCHKYATKLVPKTPVTPNVFHVIGPSLLKIIPLRLGSSVCLFGTPPDTLPKLYLEI